MVCKGALNEAADDWKHVDLLNMLGHMVAFTGTVRQDWDLSRPKMELCAKHWF